jgi:hypothetical protein
MEDDILNTNSVFSKVEDDLIFSKIEDGLNLLTKLKMI